MSQSPAHLANRYNDWCTAIIAEHLTGLKPDHFFDAAHREQSLHRVAPVAGVESDDLVQQLLSRLRNGNPQMDERLRRLVAEIVGDLQLPSFEEWVELYQADPAPFDRVLLGFESAKNVVAAVPASRWWRLRPVA